MVHAVYGRRGPTRRSIRRSRRMVSPLELMIDSGHLPVRHPGKYDIRTRTLRGENITADTENA